MTIASINRVCNNLSMEESKKEIIALLRYLKELNCEMLRQIEVFRDLGSHTVDVDMRINKSERLANRAKEEIFGRWTMYRFRIGRPHPRMLSSMQNIGKQFSGHFLDAGQAWKYPDSQRIRDIDPDLFHRREVIEADIRDDLLTLDQLARIAAEYEQRYGAHTYLMSERAVKWLQFFGGLALGVVTTLLGRWLAEIFGFTE